MSLSVRATSTGFYCLPTTYSPPAHTDTVWKSGWDFAGGYANTRATGPKTVRVGRTLSFVRPEEYKASRKMLQQQSKGRSEKSHDSSVTVTSVDFDTK